MSDHEDFESPTKTRECSICKEHTAWCCSDCAIDSSGTNMVYVCHRAECREKHEAEFCTFSTYSRKLKHNLNGHDPVKLLIQIFRKVGYIQQQSFGANLDVMTREFCQPGAEWGPRVEIKQQEDRAVFLARQADEEEDELQRSLLHLELRRHLLSGEINEDTYEIGRGPVYLDVRMARAHGWSEPQIRRAWEALRAISQAEGEIAEANNPHLYTEIEGTSVFVGNDKYREDEA